MHLVVTNTLSHEYSLQLVGESISNQASCFIKKYLNFDKKKSFKVTPPVVRL